MSANRENRPGYKNRSIKEAFGVYRPLTDESATKIWNVMGEARPDITKYLGLNRHTASEVFVPLEMGVTFLPRLAVGRAMRRGLLHRTLGVASMGQMIEQVESKTQQKVSLEVPLSHTDWYGHQERKLVYVFEDHNKASDELNIEACMVQDMLAYQKAGELTVQTPDHITLFKYGKANDGRGLNQSQKNDVGEIIEGHFTAAGIGSIALDRMIIGNSYSQPRRLE